MEQRISLVTLGVADHVAARDSYVRLGLRRTLELDGVAFFQVGGSILGPWSRAELAIDPCVREDGSVVLPRS
jgi:hypothetical protein